MYSLSRILYFICAIGVSVNGQFRSAFAPKQDEKAEPFRFAYEVRDMDVGNAHSHGVVSDGNQMKGEYQVLLPDGRTQKVSYIADDSGYNAFVQYLGEANTNDRRPRRRDDLYRFSQQNGKTQQFEAGRDLRVASQNNFPVRPKKMVVYEEEAPEGERRTSRNGQRFKKMVVFKVAKPVSSAADQHTAATTNIGQQYRAENTPTSYGLYNTQETGSQLVNKYQLRLSSPNPSQSGTYYGTSDTYKISTAGDSRQEERYQQSNNNFRTNYEEPQKTSQLTGQQNDTYFQQNEEYQLPNLPSPNLSDTYYSQAETYRHNAADASRENTSFQQQNVNFGTNAEGTQNIPPFVDGQNDSFFQQKRGESKYRPNDEENAVVLQNTDRNPIRVSETQVEIPAEKQITENNQASEQKDYSSARTTESAVVIGKARRGSRRRPDSQRALESRRNSTKNTFPRRTNVERLRTTSTTEAPIVETQQTTRSPRRRFSPRSQVVGRRSSFRDGNRVGPVPASSSRSENHLVNVTARISVTDEDDKCNNPRIGEVREIAPRQEQSCRTPTNSWSQPIHVPSYNSRNNKRFRKNNQ